MEHFTRYGMHEELDDESALKKLKRQPIRTADQVSRETIHNRPYFSIICQNFSGAATTFEQEGISFTGFSVEIFKRDPRDPFVLEIGVLNRF